MKHVRRLTWLLLVGGGLMFLPSRGFAAKSCGCSTTCSKGSCECSAEGGVSCVCSCSALGNPACNCH